jgi:hypothetical protein
MLATIFLLYQMVLPGSLVISHLWIATHVGPPLRTSNDHRFIVGGSMSTGANQAAYPVPPSSPIFSSGTGAD